MLVPISGPITVVMSILLSCILLSWGPLRHGISHPEWGAYSSSQNMVLPSERWEVRSIKKTYSHDHDNYFSLLWNYGSDIYNIHMINSETKYWIIAMNHYNHRHLFLSLSLIHNNGYFRVIVQGLFQIISHDSPQNIIKNIVLHMQKLKLYVNSWSNLTKNYKVYSVLDCV